MIHPKLASLKKVAPGETIRAEHYNALVDAVSLSITGPNVMVTGAGYLFRSPVVDTTGMKWVIVRPPIGTGGLSVTAEDAIRHPEYGESGPNQGRWIAASEATESPAQTLQTYPVWPHRITDHYVEFAWDGETKVRQSQILLAFFVGDAWYIHPDPPFIVRRRPHTAIKTPCSPQIEEP